MLGSSIIQCQGGNCSYIADVLLLTETLDKFSNHLCDQDKFRILISQTELGLAC